MEIVQPDTTLPEREFRNLYKLRTLESNFLSIYLLPSGLLSTESNRRIVQSLRLSISVTGNC